MSDKLVGDNDFEEKNIEDEGIVEENAEDNDLVDVNTKGNVITYETKEGKVQIDEATATNDFIDQTITTNDSVVENIEKNSSLENVLEKLECDNCGSRLTETNKYCPNCGQKNTTHKIAFGHFFMEVLEGLFHFDSKILITIRDLFIPGRIINNYNQNKRARYVPPIRFYIFTSVIFFTLLTISTGNEVKNNSSDNNFVFNITDGTEISGSVSDTTGNYLLEQIRASKQPDELIDNYISIKYNNIKWYNRNVYRNLVKIRSGHFDNKELTHKIYKNISYSLFLLMPIFALFLMLIYRKKKLFYSEHLIFSVYLHTLAFMLLIIQLLLGFLKIDIGFIFVLIILSYMLLLLRNVYAQSWPKTIRKFLLIGIIYSILILIVLIVGVALSIIV